MEPRHLLPKPLLDRYSWQFRGACREGDPALFFLESERGQTKVRREAQAKAVCASCPVIRECMEHGLSAEEPYGIWGGLTVEERRRMTRSRVSSYEESHDWTGEHSMQQMRA